MPLPRHHKAMKKTDLTLASLALSTPSPCKRGKVARPGGEVRNSIFRREWK